MGWQRGEPSTAAIADGGAGAAATAPEPPGIRRASTTVVTAAGEAATGCRQRSRWRRGVCKGDRGVRHAPCVTREASAMPRASRGRRPPCPVRHEGGVRHAPCVRRGSTATATGGGRGARKHTGGRATAGTLLRVGHRGHAPHSARVPADAGRPGRDAAADWRSGRRMHCRPTGQAAPVERRWRPTGQSAPVKRR